VKIDKDRLLSLLRKNGEEQKADAAEGALPAEIDTDNAEHTNLLDRFGIDLAMLRGLFDKAPTDLKSKLPGGALLR
jgi:hypothetical protein